MPRALGRKPAAMLALAVLLAGALTVARPAAAAPGVSIRVMTFNVFYGGDEINLDTNQWCTQPRGCPETLRQVVATIRAADADVVGLQEATGNTRTIADRLGWYASERTQIISRYPLIDPPGANGLYVFAEVSPGGVVALSNVHLTAEPYGPYWVRDGATREEVLELERTTRLPEVAEHVARLPGLAAAGIPVFLTGDFNSPSHLDWTKEVADARDVVAYPVAWPVSKALARAGFRDSYREAHADPVARPGFTWTPGSLESVPDEVHDRIDWVLAMGSASTRRSELVGEPGGPDVDVAVDPYPSDHRGVVSTFRVTPGAMPAIVAVDSRRLFLGEDLAVRFHAPGGAGERVAIVRKGDAPSDAVTSKGTGGASDGTKRFATGAWQPGTYRAVLVDGGGEVLARIPFWAYEPDTPTTVWTTRRRYGVGERIWVRWRAAPGMRWDWLGIYAPGNGPRPVAEFCSAGYCGNARYLLYEYTHASIQGRTAFTRRSPAGWTSWPLTPGTYEIRLLLDDGYRLVAISAPFKVVR